MTSVMAAIVCSVFIVLALWHFYMACVGPTGEGAAVPSVEGKPLFVPTPMSTVGVGIVLMLFAVLVAATSGMLPIGLPTGLLVWLSYGLALGLVGRAVGEFRYVGFFKSVRGSRFSRMDTLVYSPLCLLLAAGVAVVAIRNAA
jgi:hypothetical protein